MARHLQLTSLRWRAGEPFTVRPAQPVVPPDRLPHSYYYREMYLPSDQRPSAVAWARNLASGLFHAGSCGPEDRSTSAEQLTDGPGYDYQPDWSPDGASSLCIAEGEAFEMWLLDLTSGRNGTDPWWCGQRRAALVSGCQRVVYV